MQAFSQREQEILKRSVEVLKKYLDLGKIILFGSRGKGKFNRNSDFDLAVDNEIPGIRMERKLLEEVDKVSGLYKIDIIYLRSVHAAFRDIVIKAGKIVSERRN